jgi:thioredoxin reductase/bacterioferritin-associated ferredoxin
MSPPLAFDLLVAGAGPAGSAAALAAAGQGLNVALIDEQVAAGGQVWRRPVREISATAGSPERRDGDAMRAALAASGVTVFPGHRIWSAIPGFRVDALGPDGTIALTAPALIAATGAHERVLPFPGWTLPGVLGLAAATILLKSEGVLPGRRTVVAGCGPLLYAVTAGILKAGGEVAAVIDRSSRGDWLRTVPALLAEPALLARGIGWMLAIHGRRIPVLNGWRIVEASGTDGLAGVTAAPVNSGGDADVRRAVSFSCDALAVGDGLVPGTEIPRLLRAKMMFDRRLGGWIPQVSSTGETSVRGLYAVGDGAAIRGAKAAVLFGDAAGHAAAATRSASIRIPTGNRQRGPALRFADGIADLIMLRTGDVAAIGPGTVVCRCEDVTRAEIDAAVDAGAVEINQLKHFTRCGMGPCQGRFCGDIVQELTSLRSGRAREAVGYFTGRPPLRPVPLGALTGVYTYDDIPIPASAPL